MHNFIVMNKIISLEPYRFDKQVIRETVAQIIKDFGIFDLEVTFSGMDEMAYTELKSQLVPIIKKMLCGNVEKMIALLYRIDVPEELIHNFNFPVTIEEHVTILVLERELLKVVMRKLHGTAG